MRLWHKKEGEKRLSNVEAFRRAAAQGGEEHQLFRQTDSTPRQKQDTAPQQRTDVDGRKQEIPQPDAAAFQKQKKKERRAIRIRKKQESKREAAAGPKSDVPRLEQIRRRKNERRMRRAAVVLVALVAFFLYLGGVFSASINLFSDLLDSARIVLTPGEGWPTALQMDGLVDAQPISGGIALCGSSELVLYSSTARQLRSVTHGYADPGMAAGNTRICIYNRGGNELRVESRSRSLFTQTTEYPILTAAMSSGGTMAVATRSERYLAEITVYNPNFEAIYYAYLAEYYPFLMRLSDNGRQMAVCCMKVENGTFGAQLQLYDLTKEEQDSRISVELTDCVPLQMSYTSSGTLVVVCDSFTALYNTSTGEQTARYDYGDNQLLTAAIYNSNVLLVFGNPNSTAAGSCVLLGRDLQPAASVSTDFDVRDAALGKSGFYLIGKQIAVGYNLSGEEIIRQSLESEGKKVIAGGKILAVTAKEILQLTPLKNK